MGRRWGRGPKALGKRPRRSCDHRKLQLSLFLGAILGLRWLPEKLQLRRLHVRCFREIGFRVHAVERTLPRARSHHPRYKRRLVRWLLLHMFPEIEGRDGRILLPSIVRVVSDQGLHSKAVLIDALFSAILGSSRWHSSTSPTTSYKSTSSDKLKHRRTKGKKENFVDFFLNWTWETFLQTTQRKSHRIHAGKQEEAVNFSFEFHSFLLLHFGSTWLKKG